MLMFLYVPPLPYKSTRICVCMHTCAHVCCACMHTHAHMYTCMHERRNACMHERVHERMHECMHAWIHVLTHVHARAHIALVMFSTSLTQILILIPFA